MWLIFHSTSAVCTYVEVNKNDEVGRGRMLGFFLKRSELVVFQIKNRLSVKSVALDTMTVLFQGCH